MLSVEDVNEVPGARNPTDPEGLGPTLKKYGKNGQQYNFIQQPRVYKA